MIKREVQIPTELVENICQLVREERYEALVEAFGGEVEPSQIFLSVEEARALITLAVVEKRKAWLRYPYYDEDHPRHSTDHETKFDDIQMGLYEKIVYYVGAAFPKENFDGLL
jgi:hypothetical protein